VVKLAELVIFRGLREGKQGKSCKNMGGQLIFSSPFARYTVALKLQDCILKIVGLTTEFSATHSDKTK
jgi:hypothetical protein